MGKDFNNFYNNYMKTYRNKKGLSNNEAIVSPGLSNRILNAYQAELMQRTAIKLDGAHNIHRYLHNAAGRRNSYKKTYKRALKALTNNPNMSGTVLLKKSTRRSASRGRN